MAFTYLRHSTAMLTRRNFLQVMGAAATAALTGTEFLGRGVASAALHPNGSNGIEHVVVLMMENRSFDHFLSWLPGADGRHDLTFLSTDGNTYPNYPLAPDFQGCGYSDPDHSWEGWLVQHNGGLRWTVFCSRPTAPPGQPRSDPGRRQYVSRRLLHQSKSGRHAKDDS